MHTAAPGDHDAAVDRMLEVDAVLQHHATTCAVGRLPALPPGRFLAVNLSERALVDADDALRILGVGLGQGFHLGRPSNGPWTETPD